MGALAMTELISKTFQSLFEPKIFKYIFLPFLVSIVALLLFVWLSFDFWLAFIKYGWAYFQPLSDGFARYIPNWLSQFIIFLGPIFHFIFFLALVGLFFPLMVIISLGVTSFLASTSMVKVIASKDYPELTLQGHSRVGLGLWNLAKASFLYLFFWVVTLPLWLIPMMQLVLPLVLTAEFNRRVCTFDALTEHANNEEFEKIRRSPRKKGFMVGLLTASINYIPFAFMISPVLTMIAFCHLALTQLSLERKAKIT